MLELDRIILKQYLELEPDDRSDYDFALKFAIQFTKCEDTFSIKDVSEIEFGLVKEYMQRLEQMTYFELLDILKKIKDLNYLNMPLDVFSRGVSWLNNEIENLIEIEGKMLVSNLSAKELNAGDKLDGLGYYLQERELCGGDITKLEAIRSLPYSACFTELYARKKINDYQKALK